jgi:hypothetical protein
MIHRPVTRDTLPQRWHVTRLPAKEVDMATVMAVLLLSVWGLMIAAAPRRKRYGHRRSGSWHSVGDSSIDGEENSASSTFVAGYGGDSGGADAGSADAGSDCGGGGDGGGCD